MSFSYLWSQGTASLWPQIWVDLFKQLMNQSPVNIMYNKEKSTNWPNSISSKKGVCYHATPNLAVRLKCSIAFLSRQQLGKDHTSNNAPFYTFLYRVTNADISGWFRLQYVRDFLTQSETIIQNTFTKRPIKGDYWNHGTSFRINSWELIYRWYL